MITYEIEPQELKDAVETLGIPNSIASARKIICAVDVPRSVEGLAQRMHIKKMKPLTRHVYELLKSMPEEYEILTALGYEADPHLYRRFTRCDLMLVSRILDAYPNEAASVEIIGKKVKQRKTEPKLDQVRFCRDCGKPREKGRTYCPLCALERKKNYAPVATSNHHNSGNLWWNNGIINKRSKECPGPEWVRGQLR